MEQLLGKEWGIWVSRSSDELTLHMPVESGFASFSFDFLCSEDDLRVLSSSRFRRKILELILHVHLQPSTIRGGPKIETLRILRIIETVLHGTLKDIEQEIQASPESSYIRSLITQTEVQMDT